MKNRKYILVLFIFVVFAVSFIASKVLYDTDSKTVDSGSADKPVSSEITYRRIVSLSPSITEVLFSLGLGDRVAGVTRYCDYPPEALSKTSVGGYYDPNYEVIASLNPDLIVMLPEHEAPKKYFRDLGFNMLVVNHRSINGILESILTVGNTCGAAGRAEEITGDIRARMKAIRDRTRQLPRRRVMISVGGDMGDDGLKSVYIAGQDGFFSDMIAYAGGVNAYDGNVAFPVVSGEGIMRLDPEIIVELSPDFEKKGLDEKTVLSRWDSFSRVDAVKNGRVYVFGKGYSVIPGPRFVLILEDLARVIHPDAEL